MLFWSLRLGFPCVACLEWLNCCGLPVDCFDCVVWCCFYWFSFILFGWLLCFVIDCWLTMLIDVVWISGVDYAGFVSLMIYFKVFGWLLWLPLVWTLFVGVDVFVVCGFLGYLLVWCLLVLWLFDGCFAVVWLLFYLCCLFVLGGMFILFNLIVGIFRSDMSFGGLLLVDAGLGFVCYLL